MLYKTLKLEEVASNSSVGTDKRKKEYMHVWCFSGISVSDGISLLKQCLSAKITSPKLLVWYQLSLILNIKELD